MLIKKQNVNFYFVRDKDGCVVNLVCYGGKQ